MNICYLYSEITHSIHKDPILKSFENSQSIDILTVDYLNDYDVYIIEIEKVNKHISLKLKKLFEMKLHSLIYFTISQHHSIPLFQLAFFLNAKSIITLNQDTQKVIKKIKNDFVIFNKEHNCCLLGQNLINHHSYMLYTDKNLSYASDQLLREFECEDLAELKEKVCSKLNMEELLSEDESIKKIVSSKLHDEITYFIKSITHENENFISLESQLDYDPEPMQQNYISTRIAFVELLKDKLIEKMISDKQISIITININNLKKIGEKLSKVELENFRKDALFEIEVILDKKLILSHYDNDLYVALFENISFNNLQDKAKNFHLQISNFINKQIIKPNLSLYAVDVNTTDLNYILKILDNIANKNLNKEQVSDENIQYINNLQEEMSDKEAIDFLLDSVFVNNSELKLLNLHKGMCINTGATILKKDEDEIYITYEQLQGAMMSRENKTVLQSPIFKKDIVAHVKYINLKEKIAILHKFKILENGMNVRQHGRVNSVKTIPIAISLTGSALKGVIIDISANSIAIKAKNAKSLNNILNQAVGLTFYLPAENDKYTTSKLDEKANVVHIVPMEDQYIKLICIFDYNVNNENRILEYVYSRQRNIIKDMREMIYQ